MPPHRDQEEETSEHLLAKRAKTLSLAKNMKMLEPSFILLRLLIDLRGAEVLVSVFA